MNEEALNDSFNLFASQGYNGSIEDYKELMLSNKDARADSYNLFTGEGYNGTDTDFNDLIGISGKVALTDEEVGKTNDSANVDPTAESNVMDSTSEDGSLVSQEKDTAVERLFGKNFITDFAGDLYRSAASGWTQGESLDSAMDIFNDGKNMTEDQYVEFVEQSRAMENAGQTDEMIDFSEQYAKDKEEYGSVGAFFTSWWKNPSVMTQYTAQSLSNMASSAMNSDDAALIATGGVTLGAAAGSFATPIGTFLGGLAGGMGALSGTMEVGFTTAQLLQEAAVEAGKDWNTMSDKERIDWTKEVVNNKDLYDDLTNKALKRGIAIGAIDAVTGVLSGGAGNLARKTVSTTARSAMAGAAKGAAIATTETAGGLASEIAGQLAADQELNAQEILTEGFADKTFTIINVAQGGLKGPKYVLAGEKMNGKRFREAVQIMDDATIASTDIEISNDPLMEKIILNRKTDIKIDQDIDATISGVDDRAEIITLQKKLNKLKGNDSVTAKNTRSQLTSQITEIQDKYKGSEVDVTIKQRQEAVAKAVDTKFEENFNKYYKGAKKAAKDLGFEQGPKVYKTTKGYEKAIAAKEGFKSFDEYIADVAKRKDISIEKAAEISRGSDGVFLGKGIMFIDKQKAKEVGAITGASHELLHPVFNAAIGDAKAQGKTVREFKKAMTSKQRRVVRNKLRANVDPENWNTEYLNYFSDAILKNEINYDKNLFEKLKDVVIRILKGAGFDNVSFDNGREVYNFLKEYNTSLKETGQVSEKAIEAIKTAETKRTAELRKEKVNAPEVKAATVGRVGDIQKSVNQEILDLTDALDAAEDAYAADPDNPTLEKNVELAEKALDDAEERALSGTPAIKPVVTKPKEEKKKAVKKEPKPVRTTNLAPQTAQDKKIMDTYNEGMKDTKRTSFTSSNPLPAKVENKLIPLFEGYINTLVQQKFKQYQSEALEFQDALSILRVEAVNALRTFNPARNQNLSGYVRRLIALRQPKMFEKANKEFTSSLDDVDVAGDAGVIRSFANEEMIAPENLIKASKVISPKVKDSLVSMLKKWANQNNIDFDLFRFGDVDANATVVVDGKKVTILHELLKELFPGVNPEKFLDSSTMFTGPEASVVLEKLAANDQELIELFINLLPRGAVMPKGKNKAIVKDANYGKSTKLDKSILTVFYNKGNVSERFTKDAGLIPFTLKDNVRYSDVHKAFGMDSSGNKLNYKRSGKGSAGPVLASAYKMLGRLIMNEIIRTDLGLTAEQKMNVGAGKSDLQFSKPRDALAAVMNVDFLDGIIPGSTILRDEGRDFMAELSKRLSAEEVKKYILPIVSGTDASKFNKDSSLLFRNRFDFFTKLSINDKKFKTYDAGKGFINLNDKEKSRLKLSTELSSKYTQGARTIEKIKAFIKNIKDRQAFAKDQQKGLLLILEKTLEILDEVSTKEGGYNNKNIDQIKLGIFAYFKYLNTNKSGLIRTAAVPTHMAIIPRLLGFKNTPVEYIYEHSQTASDTSVQLLQLVFNRFAEKPKFGKNPDFKKEFNEIMEGYTVAIVPEIYDKLLNTIAKENGPVVGSPSRKNYEKKLEKPGEDGIPTRYKIPAFEKLLEKKELESLKDILTPIDQANYDAIVIDDKGWGKELHFSMNKIEAANILNKANNNANNINAVAKGISVWDFDDTLAKTKSNVLYTMPSDPIPNEKDFYNEFIAAHKDLRSKDKNRTKKLILKNGFDQSNNVNALPIFKGYDKSTDVIATRYQKYKKGDIVYLLNSEDITEGANGYKVKKGHKPKASEIITITEDGQNVFEAWSEQNFSKKKLTAEQFAKEGDRLMAEGAEFDFSEFSKVVQGSKGPFFEKAMARNKKFGNKNVFILTARPANSANAIHEFLKGIGLDVPLLNITGLANSSPQAKADWVVGKAAEGYNNFYFADDATQNVKAVDKALKKLPVKSKAELAVIKKSDIQFSMNTKYPAKWQGLKNIKDLEGNPEMITNGLITIDKTRVYLFIDDGAEAGTEALNFDFPEGTLNIGFDLEDSSPRDGRFNTPDQVPKKDVFKIFGAVINAMTDKIKMYGDEVNAITFSGYGNSREKLYNLMAKRYAAELGWKYKMTSVKSSTLGLSSTGFYVIYRPDSKPAFNEQSTEVKEVLKVIDIKSPQRSSLQFSKSMNSEFNQMIEKKSGIDARGTISKYKAAVMGRKKSRFEFFIPPGAEDFEGLLYKLLDKGKVGEQQKEWFKKTLFDPFARGINEFDTYKLQVAGAVRQLKKSLKDIPKELGKRDPKTDFKYEDAVRVYLWKLNGHEIKDISAADIKALVDIVNNSPNLKRFARQLNKIMGGYPAPQDSWLAGTVTTDAINMVNTIKRKEFLQTWQQNADIIFSEDNINKLEAMFGENYVEALQDSLYRMKSGRNRPSGANKLTNKFMNWVNDSVATIMFFNTRSALLQTLSTVNFINWGDNNPINAAKAFSNPKQFWGDFAMLFNSDFLKSRRTGLKNDVNADEIANAAATQTNKAKAALAVLLKAGFLPTQMADSFAIAMGGASFYRNRVNTYMQKGEGKPGMGRLAAEEQAFLDFQEIAEATQQSSRPDRVSQQQASPLGRIILAFANTPMQYMRLTKKAFLDLKNGRGSAKENITKMLYYAAIQNVIFSSLQAALFATLFDEEEDEETKKKGVRVANTMLDSMLRGLGIYGAVASTAKNILLEIDKQSEKDRPDYAEAAIKALDLSPPISSKIRKGRSAGRAFSYKNTREKMVGFGLDNPAYYAIGQIASSTANIPLDRAIGKANHVRLAFAQETKFWQSISLLLGFSEWDLNMMEKDKKKTKFGEKTKWKTRKFKKRKLK